MADSDMTDVELISMALNMWANRIETGNPDLTATDCKAMKKPFNALTPGAMRRVLRLRALAESREQNAQELKEQFHRLWGQAKEQHYQKPEWLEMQRLLAIHMK